MAENKIILQNEEFVLDEDGEKATGSSDITPGYLIEQSAHREFQPHSTAAEQGYALRVARKAGNIGGTIEDAYTDDGGYVKGGRVLGGVRFYGYLASGENVSYGDKLVSNGDGQLRALDTAGGDDIGAVVAVAREAVDASGGALRITAEAI